MQSKPSFKLALITGATSGIGKALADLLTEKNIEVITTGRTSPTLPIDLSKREEREKLLEVISAKTPDLIVNNAGFGLYGNTIDLSVEEQLKMIDLNISALVEISIHAAKELIKAGKKGTILNISSAASFFYYPTFNVYSSTKSFVKQFSLALDTELKGQGIRVLCACPGYVTTNFQKRAAKLPSKALTKDSAAMNSEYAALQLWKQLEKREKLNVFDWKMRMMVWISKLVPNLILEKILMKLIRSRSSSNLS